MGDFNCALNLEDKLLGTSSIDAAMRDFKECVDNIEMMDINGYGLHYTWNQKPKKGVGIRNKIDRIMGNVEFMNLFTNASAIFQPYRISDHTPCVLKLPSISRTKPQPFKFPNFVLYKPGFCEMVNSKWETQVEGVHQFKLVKKLRRLKAHIRSFLQSQGNLHTNVNILRKRLDEIQKAIDIDPMNIQLGEEESICLRQFNEASLDEERFLKQKSKVHWLAVGDANNSFFHNSLKCKNHGSRIDLIKDCNGVVHEGGNVPIAFVTHIENFLGCEEVVSSFPTPDLFTCRLNTSDADHMIRVVTEIEIRKAMFTIGDDKAPGPDGFTSAFFKKMWPSIGKDIVLAIQDFFNKGKLLKELNHTVIALIPKVTTAYLVTDFRPISCCNVIYKCISKIIADRIKDSLGGLVNINQSAFIPGRKISDNILLTQELMHNYHRQKGPPRCAFKIDIQKAYDTVNWEFLKHALLGFGFHPKMVEWIWLCVSTASFSIKVNGNIHGFFNGKRGLRQGDPLSPYLFTLVMEILTRILHHDTRMDSSFRFHNKCEKQSIINLCFADDLFMFARGDINSTKCILKSLKMFTSMSGLVPSNQKSTVFFCNVPDNVKISILNACHFAEGALPVQYLGVPLISSRLRY
ncbi:hypothetical protein QVD17_16799 [Tagetes erecta]|uniref:Reverse transcriptase domain-containing protein n=1 Tax=Tagetes erecta TaxID=13708 RepID=A0AAD8P0W5_TARER|nr:hypothetical protein QVD17_16799 [Tagetes erecta]